MKRGSALLLILFLLFVAPSFASATDYYASPTGSGTTCSIGTPCTVVQGITNTHASGVGGNTLNLNDGTYTGTTGMISIQNLDCTSRCTIRAINDGAVTIDGQSARRPLDINSSLRWTVIGINAKRSGGGSGDVCAYRGSGPTDQVFGELKRIICWDAQVAPANRHAISISNVSDVLVEDCGAFGIARNTMLTFTTLRVTVRRCWVRWNQYDNDDQPHSAGALVYESRDGIWENNIFELDDINSSQSSGGDKFGNACTTGQITDGFSSDKNARLKVLGSIAYKLTAQTNTHPWLFCAISSGGGRALTGSLFSHNVGFIESASSGIKPFSMNDPNATGSSSDHLTSITGTGGTSSSFTGNWINTNHLSQATIGTYNLYANPPNTNGATIRYRYLDGVLSTVPLWPWPMADRIATALTAGGYASHNIDTVIQNIFGTFPTEGGGGSPTLTQTYGRFQALRRPNGAEAAPILLTRNEVSPGGSATVRLKVACTANDCTAMSPAVRYSRNAGSYTAVLDAFGADNIRFVGVSLGATVPTDGTATTELLTSDHATNVTCAVVLSTATIPTVDLSQNSEAECEFGVEFDSDAVLGDTYAFRLYANSTTALDAYNTSPTLTIVAPSASGIASLPLQPWGLTATPNPTWGPRPSRGWLVSAKENMW